MTDYADITARRAAIEKKRQDQLQQLAREEAILSLLPGPAVRGLKYIHHSSLYGVKGTLAYEVQTRAQVGELLALLPPDPLNLVGHGGMVATNRGGTAPKEKPRHQSFMPADYTPKDFNTAQEVVPFFYYLDAMTYTDVSIKWNTRFEGMERPIGVKVKITRDKGVIHMRNESNNTRRCTLSESSVPSGIQMGYGYSNSLISRDSWPRLSVYWTWEMLGFITENILTSDPTRWQETADIMLEVSDIDMALAGRLEQEDISTCYARVQARSDNAEYELYVKPCGKTSTRSIVRRDDVGPLVGTLHTVCEDHAHSFTDHTGGEWFTASQVPPRMCCAEVLTGKTCYQSDGVGPWQLNGRMSQRREFLVLDLCPAHTYLIHGDEAGPTQAVSKFNWGLLESIKGLKTFNFLKIEGN